MAIFSTWEEHNKLLLEAVMIWINKNREVAQ